ncbi:unnamed protein product, partial [Mesorhabditis belari]|uniref:Peptidase C1A papain C-terminal domain-containing protein n=1 Tax=Mesorhabditis belari TaxID=2138241 RepID=A0AAF3ER06_9BILA
MALANGGDKVKKDKDNILSDDDLKHFNDFNAKFHRTCADEAPKCKEQKLNFAKNLVKLRKIKEQTKEKSFVVGLHPFMDESEKEMRKRLMDKEIMPKSIGMKQMQRSPEGAKTKINPSSFDWRNTGAVNPVKDQKQCGSCWAFSTIATVETIDNYVHCRDTTESRVSYSEQMVMDCTYYNASVPEKEQYDGCDGGWPSSALKRIMITGTETEKQDHYLAGKGVCPLGLAEKKRPVAAHPISNWANLTGDVDAMVDFIANKAPFAFCMMICEDFFGYESGVYDSTNCTEDNAVGGHAVAVMGYGTTDTGIDYWLVRNSWGPTWGEDGYFKIRRGTNVAGCEDSNVAGPIPVDSRDCPNNKLHRAHHHINPHTQQDFVLI